MLWIKALHVIFMVSWFAALLYLPRLFVYHVAAGSSDEKARFCLMEKRLFAIGSIAMLGTWVFGVWLLMMVPGYMQAGWMHAKLLLVVVLTGYHHWLIVFMRRFRSETNRTSARFFRLINEVPALFLVAIVILVIVKPF
ncbi:CopD family protein [Polycyclovorans algicola]|uniref:CopD family protein n=1 Tax=Polycyclovorans algicola TaxID=616992 RepID=UPI0004A70317|nr:CopD family protein [Polycyclovorans algicola]